MLEELGSKLKSADVAACRQALDCLARLDYLDSDIASLILLGLDHKDVLCRLLAVEVLGRLRPDTTESLTLLLKTLMEEESAVSRLAEEALDSGRVTPETIDALLDAIKTQRGEEAAARR